MIHEPPVDSAALYESADHVATITLNRPHVLNAVNAALSAALSEALDRAENDPDVRVIIIRGAGRAFCAGADLKALAAGESLEDPQRPDAGFAGITQRWVDKPLIAAVQGYAMGGGLEIVLACDLAVVAQDAKLGLPEVTRGLVAGAGGVLRLPRTIPARVALHLGLTGEPMTAEEAQRWGLVSCVSPPESVLERADQLARRIAANAPLAVRSTKSLMRRTDGHGTDWPQPAGSGIWETNAAIMREVAASPDALEGAAAFTERRAPRWRT